MKKKSNTQTLMKTVSAICFVCIVVFWVLFKITDIDVFFTLSIVALTTFYHFFIRLIIGGGINSLFQNHMNYKRWWFQERKFEAGLYKKLQVKKWKSKLPTYNPEIFDIRTHSIQEVVEATCQSEIVHEIDVLASFVPLLFSLAVGTFYVFLITSILAACYDMIFVIMQRYNRPRLLKMLGRKPL